jgi:hypothetical protein
MEVAMFGGRGIHTNMAENHLEHRGCGAMKRIVVFTSRRRCKQGNRISTAST